MDDELTLLKFQHAPEEVLTNFPEWRVQLHNSLAEEGGAVLHIRATNPDLLKDVDPTRIAKANKASGEALTKFREYTMNDRITWSIISIPSGDWAQKVFPNQSKEEAVQSLWDAIVKIVRVDQDNPIAAWEKHNETLKKAHQVLNQKKNIKINF